MAKKIEMTRARKVALPVILSAARAATRHVPMTGDQRRELEEALEAFREQ
jgi:hypothetical protein